jgi:hypothetical protein
MQVRTTHRTRFSGRLSAAKVKNVVGKPRALTTRAPTTTCPANRRSVDAVADTAVGQ